MYKPVRMDDYFEQVASLSKLLKWVVHTVHYSLCGWIVWLKRVCLFVSYHIFHISSSICFPTWIHSHLNTLWQFTKLTLGRLWQGLVSWFHVLSEEPSCELSLSLSTWLLTAFTTWRQERERENAKVHWRTGEFVPHMTLPFEVHFINFAKCTVAVKLIFKQINKYFINGIQSKHIIIILAGREQVHFHQVMRE